MGILRSFLSVGIGLAAGAFAYKLLEDYNKKNHLEGEYIELPPHEEDDLWYEPEQSVSPQKSVQRPDHGPNPNPVTLGTSEKPLMENGKLDPTRIASAEDFVEWDEMGCQS